MSRPELFSPVELDFLWEAAGVGELPYPLELISHGYSMDERSALRRQTVQRLADRGLFDRYGRLEPEIDGWLGQLSRAQTAVDSVFVDGDNPAHRSLAVDGASRGLIATQDEQGLWLRPVPAGSQVSSLLELLPRTPRGTERALNVPADQQGISADDRKVLDKLMGTPRRRGGQLGVNLRKQLGGRLRSPVLAWFDDESGRYLTYRKTGPDGREWITIAPADDAALRHRLAELTRELNRSVSS